MGPVYLSGVLSAWCLAQLALGVFFAAASLVARRERDLLIYGAMCFALAFHSASSARAHVAPDVAGRLVAVTGVMQAAILAAAINVHFVVEFAGVRGRRRLVYVVYAVAMAFELVLIFGQWWRVDSAVLAHARVFGAEFRNWRAEPTLFARAGFATVAIELVLGQIWLLRAARAGQHEAFLAFGGGSILVLAAANDMLLSMGVLQNALFLVPHAYMIYALSVASTLVFRYRRTIGELTRTERELRSTANQLSASHTELREMQSELTRKEQLAAVGELAAAIAHEVRNPLAIIANAVAGLRRPKLADPDRTTLLQIVSEEADRLNNLVTDLLRFARPTQLKPSRIDLLELLQRTSLPPGESHTLEVERDGELPLIEADAALLLVAFDNLLLNSAQAMPAGGSIEVTLSEGTGVRGGVTVSIRDRGSGMDSATLARALDPFFTTRPSGTGLGLPIVQRVVQAHGGTLELESERGQGTTARVWLPVDAGRAEGSDAEQPAATESGLG